MIKLKPKLINKYFPPEIKQPKIENIIDRGYAYQYNTWGEYSADTTKNYIEILNFRHFFKYFVFTSEDDKIRNKQLKKYINVSVVIDMECGNTIK